MTEKKRGGARPGAGRPRSGRPEFTEEQWQLIVVALREHSVLDPAANAVIDADELADTISDWRAAVRHAQRNFEMALKAMKDEENTKLKAKKVK